jgi:hypothetical protein
MVSWRLSNVLDQVRTQGPSFRDRKRRCNRFIIAPPEIKGDTHYRILEKQRQQLLPVRAGKGHT